jgi:hypothetical protein
MATKRGNGHGGKREGAGRPKGTTRRVRFFLKSVAGEEGMFDLLPDALACLKRQMENNDTAAALGVIRYCLLPPEKRDDLVRLLQQLRLQDEPDEAQSETH